MLCPVCKKELVIWKNLRLETLGEHVGAPNERPCEKPAFHCPDEKCSTRTVRHIFWDDIEGGMFYDGEYMSKEERATIPFIDGLSAPFGSFNRGFDAAKKAEEKVNTTICTLPTWLWKPLDGMEIRWNWSYSADENGNLTGRHFGLHWLRREVRNGYVSQIYHNWGWHMFCFSIKQDFRAWLGLRKNPNATYLRNHLVDTTKRMQWDNADWWRIWSGRVAKLLLKFLPPTKSVLDKYPNIVVQ
jgi:hypothetical protein